MSDYGTALTSLKMLKTVKLKDEAAGYSPFVTLPYAKSTTGDWPCWPEKPLRDQIDNAGCVEAGTISSLFCARQFTKWDIPIYNVDLEKGGRTGT